jgi:hypothetical protein
MIDLGPLVYLLQKYYLFGFSIFCLSMDLMKFIPETNRVQLNLISTFYCIFGKNR